MLMPRFLVFQSVAPTGDYVRSADHPRTAPTEIVAGSRLVPRATSRLSVLSSLRVLPFRLCQDTTQALVLTLPGQEGEGAGLRVGAQPGAQFVTQSYF
jgi:hypothetical protein